MEVERKRESDEEREEEVKGEGEELGKRVVEQTLGAWEVGGYLETHSCL